MAELDVRIFLRHRQHVRIEIAERGREDQRRAIEVDHRLHGLLDVDSLRHVLLFHHGEAGHALQRSGAFGVRLIVAVVVLRADIDEAGGQVGGEGSRDRLAAESGQRGAGCAGFEKFATGGMEEARHRMLLFYADHFNERQVPSEPRR